MRRCAVLALLVSLVALAPGAISARVPPDSVLEALELDRCFSTADTIPFGPDGVAYHPERDTLFAVDADESMVFELSTDGDLVDSFDHVLANGRPGFPEGIDVAPNGDIYVSDQTNFALTEYTTDGDVIRRRIFPETAFPTSVAFHTGTGTFFVADDDELGPVIFEFSAEAGPRIVSLIDPLPFDILEPEGIGFDTVTGNLLVVDDEAATLTEITTGGDFVNMVDLADLTGFEDPEGVGVDQAAGLLYISFDTDREICVFLPEPGVGVSLLASVGLLAALRRRRA